MNRRRKGRPATQSIPMSRFKATVLLIFFYTTIWGIVLGSGFNAFGKLPSQVLVFASTIAAFITFLGALWGFLIGAPNDTIKNFIRTVWKRARHGLSELVGMVVGTIVILALVALSPLFGQSSGLNPTTTSTPSPIATQTYTIKQTKWYSLLKQPAPNCNNPKGVVWYVHLDGTFEKCSGSALLMQRISPQYYADMELTQVNGMTYNQTTFRVQVQVIFQNPGDTGTLAGLLVQTPAQLNAVGGYIFTLSSNGEWQLQDVLSGTDIPIVEQGSVSIDSSRPIIMSVEVKDGLLYGYINGAQVVWFHDNLNPQPGQVGLEVQGPAPSSLILYSNFELDM